MAPAPREVSARLRIGCARASRTVARAMAKGSRWAWASCGLVGFRRTVSGDIDFLAAVSMCRVCRNFCHLPQANAPAYSVVSLLRVAQLASIGFELCVAQ